MINRLFRTMIICGLCLGVSFPTNASAVSVSDGAAFITKSEVASQLNNLSTRMAQLENSLDSHIDQLVSSYLTRNGIWSGDKQTTNIVTHDLVPVGAALQNYACAFDMSLASGVYIANLNKSGMLLFTYSYKNKDGVNDNNTRFGYSGEMQANTNHCADNAYLVSLNIYERNGTSSEKRFSIVFLNAIGWPAAKETGNSRVYNIYCPLPTSYVSGNVLCFVNKGNKITYDIREIAHFYFTSSVSPAVRDTNTLHFVINDDAVVY